VDRDVRGRSLITVARLVQSEIQGNILCGYGNSFAYGLFGFFRLKRPDAGRALLGQLLGEGDGITNAMPWARDKTPWYTRRPGQVRKPVETRNVAFSYEGLAAIGVPAEVLDAFPADYRGGMAAKADHLGDTGPSAPAGWDPGLQQGEPHLLVTITAQEQATRDRRREWLSQLEAASNGGVELVHHVDAGLLDHPKGERTFAREHFGFADGVSQPTIAARNAGPNKERGKGTPRRLGWNDVAPGEFVIGYEDEDGVVSGEELPRLARNGSFAVVRKLHQDVATFNGFLRDAAERRKVPEELLAAKIVGRWRSGAPLALAPEQDDHALTATGKKAKRINDFRYGADADGLRCPVGAHVRRANPRDALGWEGKLTKRHRIIRRGMPYGPRPQNPLEPDAIDRGLMFVCYQASIERQFEVVQARWMSDGDVFGLGSDTDFLVSAGALEGKLGIPWEGRAPTLLAPQPRFVTTRGGGYFFAPGISALGRLARGEPVA
jgi:Dyp-type peroxidase family